jgi:peptidoglycan/LPS O-acetylase OafA/YrhL
MSLDAALIALLLTQLVCLCENRAWSWLEAPVFRFAGRISYSFYLYHLTCIVLVSQFLNHMRWSIQLTAALGLSVVLSTLSFNYIETPFLRLKKRFAPNP